MGHKTIRHTIKRNGIYYVSFRLSGHKYFRRSLETDSHSHAQLLMSFASPAIPLVKRGTIHPDQFGQRLSDFSNRLKQQNEHWLALGICTKRKKPKTGRRQFHRPMRALWKSCSLSWVHLKM